MYPYQPPPPPQVVHHYHQPRKEPGIAIALELVPGFLFQTFGIGHFYAGNVALGLVFMFGYWFVTAINFALCFIFIGFVTWPICWLAMMIMSPILAANFANAANKRDRMVMAPYQY